MDRCRFEYPDDVYEEGEEVPEYSALVWDRGPAGDFVYGKFSELSIKEKLRRYDDFRAYDAQCKEEGVLFFKLLFVADKDSIAATLGKRLAHKKIAQDLHTWLDANSFEHAREGLDEIELHIDPTGEFSLIMMGNSTAQQKWSTSNFLLQMLSFLQILSPSICIQKI